MYAHGGRIRNCGGVSETELALYASMGGLSRLARRPGAIITATWAVMQYVGESTRHEVLPGLPG